MAEETTDQKEITRRGGCKLRKKVCSFCVDKNR